MNSHLLYDLISCETDVDGAVKRLCGDESLYQSCLVAFLSDRTVDELEKSLAAESWDDAFTAAHALKGLSGNLGFVPLFYAVGELVVLIRAGRTNELAASFQQVRRCYNDIYTAIQFNCGNS